MFYFSQEFVALLCLPSVYIIVDLIGDFYVWFSSNSEHQLDFIEHMMAQDGIISGVEYYRMLANLDNRALLCLVEL